MKNRPIESANTFSEKLTNFYEEGAEEKELAGYIKQRDTIIEQQGIVKGLEIAFKLADNGTWEGHEIGIEIAAEIRKVKGE